MKPENCLLFFCLVFLFACGNDPRQSEQQSQTSIEMSTVKPPQNVVEFYNQLSPEQAPPITEAWGQWVVNFDNATEAYPNYEEFRMEFPHEVTVDKKNGFIRVSDTGTGGGTTTWEFTIFKRADGNYLCALTETLTEPESTDSEIWFGQWTEKGFEKVQAMTGLDQEDFFTPGVEHLLGKYPLISLIYQLPQQGTDLTVNSQPNYPFQCEEGKLLVSNVPANDVTAICDTAWPRYTTRSMVLSFDREAGKFIEKERISVQ